MRVWITQCDACLPTGIWPHFVWSSIGLTMIRCTVQGLIFAGLIGFVSGKICGENGQTTLRGLPRKMVAESRYSGCAVSVTCVNEKNALVFDWRFYLTFRVTITLQGSGGSRKFTGKSEMVVVAMSVLKYRSIHFPNKRMVVVSVIFFTFEAE